MERSFRFAVIADAHFHDPNADFGFDASATEGLALRPLSEISRTMRLFNETADTLDHVLTDIGHRGIRNVVLLGDYSDDGQAVTLGRLRGLLDRHSRHFGTRFHAIPGNHDVFATTGRNGTRRFLTADGHATVTSDPRQVGAHNAVLLPGMQRPGYSGALSMLPEAGLGPQAGDLHWETPFGNRPPWQERGSALWSNDGLIGRRVPDCSYLVEPFPGTWFLFLDANVFRPHNAEQRPQHDEEFADCTNEGWTSVLTEKPFILNWVADVARRADKSGKRLIAFSHYPVLNAREGKAATIAMGLSGLKRRIPSVDVGRALRAAGIRLHFGGHVHLDATTRTGSGSNILVDIAVPSLAAYPQAWKLVTMDRGTTTIETIPVGPVPIRPAIRRAYRAEYERTGDGRLLPLIECETVRELVLAHAKLLVTRRHLRRDWPEELSLTIGRPDGLPLDVVVSWYLALSGGPLSGPDIEGAEAARQWLRTRGDEPGIENAVAQSLLDFLALPDDRRVTLPV